MRQRPFSITDVDGQVPGFVLSRAPQTRCPCSLTVRSAGTSEMPRDAANELRRGFWRDRDFILLRHKDSGTVVQALGKLDGLDGVLMRDPSGENETKVLLDPKTHHIVRLEYVEAGGKGVEIYSDYRDVGGLWFAFTQRAQGGDQAFDVSLDKVEVDPAIDEKIFAAPK